MSLGIVAFSRLETIRKQSIELKKQEQLIRMKEAVIQSQGRTILKMRRDNEALRVEVQRANVYVAVEEALKHD
jgi:hypothetical protein